MTTTVAVFGSVLFLVYILAVLVGLRLSQREPTAVVTLSSVAIYVWGLTFLALYPRPTNFWALSVTYWFLVLSFLMVFGAVYKSLSLRMLKNLLEVECRAIKRDELARLYIKEQSFADRLRVMSEQGLALITQDRVSLTERGRAWATIARRLQVLFRIEKSG